MSGVTWLHLSDWNQKGNEFDRLVLRDALIKDIKNREKIDPKLTSVDFIIFSGNVAFSAQIEEFEAAVHQFFDPLLSASGISRDRLFIVPGNHDIDRSSLAQLPNTFLHPLESNAETLSWLIDDQKRNRLLGPFEVFSNFVANYTGQNHPDYACIREWNINGKKIAVLGLNSAWMCGRNKDSNGVINDRGSLLIGEPQIHNPLNQISEADIKIAVLHHPFDWLAEFDRNRVEPRLMQACDFILHGHTYVPQAKLIHSNSEDCVLVSTGAAYNKRISQDPLYISAYNFVHLDFDTRKGTIFIRRWSEKSVKWIEDVDSTPEGKFIFELPKNKNAEIDSLVKKIESILPNAKDENLHSTVNKQENQTSYSNNGKEHISSHQNTNILSDQSQKRTKISQKGIVQAIISTLAEDDSVLDPHLEKLLVVLEAVASELKRKNTDNKVAKKIVKMINSIPSEIDPKQKLILTLPLIPQIFKIQSVIELDGVYDLKILWDKIIEKTNVSHTNQSSNIDASIPQKRSIRPGTYPLADTWSKIDLLYFSDYANAIVDFIKNERNREPLVIGIDAAWGMGKTTLMRLIERELLNEFRIRSVNILDVSFFGKSIRINRDISHAYPCVNLNIKRNYIIKNRKLGDKIDTKNYDYLFPTIWFNAWKYDREDSLLAALIIDILDQIKNKYSYGGINFWIQLTKKRFGLIRLLLDKSKTIYIPFLFICILIWNLATIKPDAPLFGLNLTSYRNLEFLRPFISVETSYLLTLFLIIGASTASYIVLRNIYKNPFQISINRLSNTSDFEEKIGFVREFETIFSNVVSIITKSTHKDEIKKLVVIIDDLDRCKPPKSVDVIEAISTLLDAENCVFIIGMDSKMVELSIESKYESLVNFNKSNIFDDLSLGKSFLEKIIQINFSVPDPSPDAFSHFIEKTLLDMKGESLKDKLEPSREEIEKAKKSIELEMGDNEKNGIVLGKAVNNVRTNRSDLSRGAINEAENDLFTQYLFEERYELFEENSEVIKAIRTAPRYLGYNPRKMKRFINNFRLQAMIAHRRRLLDNGIINLCDLSKLIIICMRWPKLLDLIKENKISFNQVRQPHEREKLVQSHNNQYFENILMSKEFVDFIDDFNINSDSLDAYLCLANITNSIK